MTDHRQYSTSSDTQRDVPGIVLGSASLVFGLVIHLVIPFEVSVEPIPGASQYIGFTPAALPRLCATAFMLLGILQIARSVHERSQTTPDNKKPRFNLETVRNLAVLAAALIAYAIAMPLVGYVPATVAFLLLLISYGGERRLTLLILCSVGVPISIYLLFGRLMSIPLPDARLLG